MDRLIKNIMARIAKKREDYYLNDDVYDKVSVDALDFACDVIEEEVKEYNNGWIPCEVRLPELEGNTSDTVLVYGSIGFQYMAFWCSDGQWRFCQCGTAKEPMDWTDIIAWMPLPAPYKEKGNEE